MFHIGMCGDLVLPAELWGMSEADVVATMRQHLEGHFPLSCPVCHQGYATLRDYLLQTERQGDAIPFDAELGNWRPLRPLGTVALANCRCGNTLGLSSEGMPLPQLWRLLNWARVETQKRQQTPRELLNYLRGEICTQVLAECMPREAIW